MFDELSRNQIYILQVMSIIGMVLNVFSYSATHVILWIAFWLTFVYSGKILVFSLCSAYVPMLNKYSVYIWLVRLHEMKINFVVEVWKYFFKQDWFIDDIILISGASIHSSFFDILFDRNNSKLYLVGIK